jgi:hypothetical protein
LWRFWYFVYLLRRILYVDFVFKKRRLKKNLKTRIWAKMKINDIDENSSTIHIHNVYNLSLIFYSLQNSSFTFSKTRRFLIETFTNHHILLKISIFIIFFKNDSSKSTQYVTTNEFLNIIKKHDLTLTLFKKLITWKNRITTSIIDFTFITIYLIDGLKHCTTRFNLSQSSNHMTISIRIFCEIESNLSRISRRTWKSIDLKKIKKAEKNASILSRSSSTRESMNTYVKFKNFCNRWWKRFYFKRYSIDTSNSSKSKNVMMQSEIFVDLNVVDHSLKI